MPLHKQQTDDDEGEDSDDEDDVNKEIIALLEWNDLNDLVKEKDFRTMMLCGDCCRRRRDTENDRLLVYKPGFDTRRRIGKARRIIAVQSEFQISSSIAQLNNMMT